MTRPGTVHKSAEGWARFQARTDNGKHKRAAVKPFRAHRPKGGHRA